MITKLYPKPLVKKNRYNNIKVVYKGKTFDSKKEARRYRELLLLETNGDIKDLELQPKFKIVPKTWDTAKKKWLKARYYIADFKYCKNGKIVVEDVKSEPTKKDPVYRLKRQLLLNKYGRTIIFNEI